MALDGVKSSTVKMQAKTTEVVVQKNNEKAQKEELNNELQGALNGTTGRKSSKELGSLTPNEKKELIKYYQEMGYSKKEAKALFDSKTDKLDKMSRKEAKSWCKDYMEKNGCSKKEARAAFKSEFGYDVPLNKTQQGLRYAIVNSSPIGVIASMADRLSGGKLGIKKFITGQGNNDSAYVRKDENA